MILKTKIKKLLFMFVFLFVSTQEATTQTDKCKLIVKLITELEQAENPEELFTFFESNLSKRIDALYVLNETEPNLNLLNTNLIYEVEEYIDLNKLNYIDFLEEIQKSGLTYIAWKLQRGDAMLSKMMDFEPFLSVYNDVKAGLYKPYENFSIEESAIIKMYDILNIYEKFNQALKQGNAEVMEIAKLFNNVLDKSPEGYAISSRAVVGEEFNELLSIGEGGKITYRNFLTLHSVDKVTLTHLEDEILPGEQGAFLMIESGNTSSKSLSKYISDSNWLRYNNVYKNNTEFLIKKIEKPKEGNMSFNRTDLSKYYVITLEEI